VYLCSFLTSTLDYVSGQLHAPAALPLGGQLPVLTQGWLGPSLAGRLLKKRKVPFPCKQ